jgi:acyl CoA:acetate/3-ketoacid CoA transferase beta subunit
VSDLLEDVCVAAVADLWRDEGVVLASPTVGYISYIGTRLAKATFAPDLVITDGEAGLVANIIPIGPGPVDKVLEGYMPYREVFHRLWSGRRHVIMGAAQIGRYGDQNIACIGPWERPRSQLVGVRGAPGNTASHTVSYWVPVHSRRVFVEPVDFVSGIGYQRAKMAGDEVARRHRIARVITDLCVLDFETPDHALRIRSVHPGVTIDRVREATGFDLVVPEHVPESRGPTADELRWINDVLDPKGLRLGEVRRA